MMADDCKLSRRLLLDMIAEQAPGSSIGQPAGSDGLAFGSLEVL
jgi:hypothetical protein